MFKSLLLKVRVMCLLFACILSSLAVTAQTRVTGRVIGADDKQGVVGAAVRIKGTTVGTVTDVNGNFSLNASNGQTLVITYVGYKTQEVAVSGGPINVTLAVATNQLEDVVVTGYTTQVKKDITGSVAVVSVNDAKKLPATSSEQLLQGQASGVTVINQGAPGANSTVFIRGVNNFGNTSPLYVIDGVQTNNMSQVNPTDIESISVLKDAGSAAIYGVAGGNGVIVVTTKKGRSGKSTFTYDGYYGVQKPLSGNVWRLMTPAQQSQLAYQAGDAGQINGLYAGGAGSLPTYGFRGAGSFNGAASGVTNDASVTALYKFDAANPNNDFLVQKFNQAGTDWFHELFRSAPQQSHTITASGGNDNNTYLYSLNYLNQKGTLLNTFEKRYTARANTTFSYFNNKFRVGESGYVFYRENNGGSGYNQQQEGGTVAETYRQLPLIPVYDIAGNFGGNYAGTSAQLGNATNPVATAMRSVNDRSKTWNMQGTLFAELDFLKHFTARSAFSGNARNNFYYYTGYNPYNDSEPHGNPNQYNTASNYSYTFNTTNTVQYKQIFGKHNISAIVGYEFKRNGGQQLGVQANNFFTLDPNFLTVAGTTDPTSIILTGGNGTYLYQPTSTQSLFAKVDYSFADKYLLGGSVRRDGYSSFFPGRKYGTFPAGSIGWRIGQEEFLKGSKVINDLKLRASYGSLGSNANISGTNSVDTYNYGPGSSFYGIAGGVNSTQLGFYQTSIGNPSTTWETDKILNIGFDLSIVNHFDITAEYYQKRISGLLFPLQLPATAGGAGSPVVNLGNVENKGFDISATYHDQVGEFRYSIGANITTYKNTITSLPDPGYFDLGVGSRIGTLVREQVGHPIGSFFGYKVAGINQSTADANSGATYSGAAAGSYKYVDVNGDGKIDDNDRTFIGNPNPDFTYGLNLNASYKGFDFSAVFYGSQGNKIFNHVKYFTDTYAGFVGGKRTELLTNSAIVANGVVTNPGATLPVLTFNQALGSSAPSTFYIENGSFLRMKVAQLGYTFAPSVLKAVGVSKLHVYLQGNNLFTITKYTGPDPELVPSINNLGNGDRQSAAFGIDFGAYPNNQKSFLLGVNMTF
ncbi:SusC/RagA family TonB-linked outer membrane protein [Mucilaginibacter ginkgonis]|uniref:TonB-dependent receptor n=1 Tax=Mucilaginibacter ginkgonis TaxID=2682091 RepID=A0A6I4INP9_9SPHI|nr:TonB-dependent receptor [Mucilaginibacter ginkgonis]QQL48653.1 TonB-dependent receptor [Mucilaginibacter ginkgonis]